MEDDTAMAQEDQTQNYSNGSSGGGGNGGVGRSSKKPKQKKVPQRGLGVAQLEKIRLEEQQKKAAAAILSSQGSVPSTKSTYLPLPIQNLHHSNQPASSPIPLPSGSPAEFRSPLSLQHMMDAKGPTPSNAPLANSVGFEAGWPSVSPPGHGNVPKLCGSQELDFEERFGVDPGLQFLPRLPVESNPIWPLPNLVQRTPQYHQPASSIVNVSSGTSSAPVPHFSIEPPSNQNYSCNGVPVRPAEKMVGMKRPYPFSLDVPPVPAFNYKLHPFDEMRTNATASCGSGSGFNSDAGNSTLREVRSCSASNSEPNSRKSNKEGENFNGEFLTLAPPTPTSCPPSNFKSFSAFLAFHKQKYPEFESPSCQGIIEDQVPPPQGYNRFNQHKQPLYCFFPPAADESQIGQTTARTRNGNGVEENVDLNLKL